ncbi:ABC transporter permease [uncultured Granulicatella sp.]|uniref:ABC transporter permease n=1 Tax=uncultured Granulicatella sp. TaxID=316089 RepID=UPI0028D34D24|nr:ABC transporter permease [uncultured Granulicatella sp.]
MNSEQLWGSRFKTYQKKVMKYAKYMMNDHFMIVFFFLFGFLLFQYSTWLKTIRILEWPLILFVSLLLAVFPLFGEIATYVEEADLHFLSVIGEDFKPYFKRAIRYSWIFPLVMNFIATIFVLPIFMQAYGNGMIPFIAIFVTLLSLKGFHFMIQKSVLEGKLPKNSYYNLALYLVNSICLLGILSFIPKVFSLSMTQVLAVLAFELYRFASAKPVHFKWNEMIQSEQARQQRIFRVIALFVDVPFLKKHQAKRNQSLDIFVKRLTPNRIHPYRYLLVRTALRSSNYVTVFLQMIVATVLLSFVSSVWYWIMAIQSIMIVVICFQFASLYKHPKAHSIYIHSLYNPKEMMDDFIGVVLQLVIGASTIISLLTVLVSRNVFVLSGLVWYPLLSAVFLYGYLKPRLNRKKKRR